VNTSQTLAGAMLAAAATRYGGGSLVFYTGTMPATPESPLAGNTVLLTYNFAPVAFTAPAFSASNEQMVANFITSAATPAVGGTVGFARAWASDGATALADYTVGSAGTDIIIASTNITLGVPVTLNPFTQMLPAV